MRFTFAWLIASKKGLSFSLLIELHFLIQDCRVSLSTRAVLLLGDFHTLFIKTDNLTSSACIGGPNVTVAIPLLRGKYFNALEACGK